jgi:hypothetical protein
MAGEGKGHGVRRTNLGRTALAVAGQARRIARLLDAKPPLAPLGRQRLRDVLETMEITLVDLVDLLLTVRKLNR